MQVDGLLEALAKQSPTADSKVIEEAGKVVPFVSQVVLSGTGTAHRSRAIGSDAVFNLLHEVRVSIEKLFVPADSLSETSSTDNVPGSGLGEIIGLKAGLARLSEYADKGQLDDWAGPTASAADLPMSFGISLPILQRWRRQHAVIALSQGRRRPVFPLLQFVQSRPVPGLAELQIIIGEPRKVWLWLIEPGSNGVPSWLDALKEGREEEVLEAAIEDFA